MANDIIDINVTETTETVAITVNPNLTTVNINQVSGGGSGVTDLGYTPSPTNGTVTSSTGSSAVIPLADGTNAGLITPAEKTKIANSVPYTGAVSDVNLGEFGIQLGNLEFDNTPTNIPTTAGSLYYNDTDGTLDLKLKGGNVTLQIGQEQVVRVVNKTATSIDLLEANYQAVRLTGVQGQRLKVDLAQATTDVLSSETIGLVTETIANNAEGFVTTSGLIRGINTTGSLQSETWLDGDILYLSPTVAGRITKVKPTAPNHLIIIGYVVHAHATQGTIFVKVDNGYELDELHNVKITTAANNNVLAYTSATDIWENKTVETALGFTPYNATNPSGYQTAGQVQTIADAKVVQTITNGVTTTAPSQDAVFDALALKQPLATVLTNTTASFTTADETKLDKYPSTATIGKILQGDGTNYVEINTPTGSTNLTYTAAPTIGTVFSDTGNDAVITLADATNAGLLSPAEKTKLAGIATGATANSSDATLLARANHTGTQLASTISDIQTTITNNTSVLANTAKISFDSTSSTRLANTSGTNTGDETTATIKTKLGITTLSGSNTGDQNLSGYALLASPTFSGTPSLPTGTTGTTQTALNNSTKLATTAYVEAACAVVAASNGVTVSSQDTFGTARIATVTATQYAAFVTAGTVVSTTLYFITA